MNEIKQLWMNRLFRKAVLVLAVLLMSVGIIYLTRKHWMLHQSWIKLSLWVFFWQAVFFIVWKLGQKIAWRQSFAKLASLRHKKIDDPSVERSVTAIKTVFRTLSRHLSCPSLMHARWGFLQKKISLPWYICFASDRARFESLLAQNEWKSVPFSGGAEAEERTEPCLVDVRVFEKAVFFLVSDECLNQALVWTCFLKQLSKCRSQCRNFSIFLQMDDADFKDNAHAEHWIQTIRGKIDEVITQVKQPVAVYGLESGLLESQAVLDFLAPFSKVTEQEVLSVELPVQTAEVSKEQALTAFFENLVKRFERWRMAAIEKSENTHLKWQKFLFPSEVQSAFYAVRQRWVTFVGVNPFYLPSSMTRLYLLVPSASLKRVWEDVWEHSQRFSSHHGGSTSPRTQRLKQKSLMAVLSLFIAVTVLAGLHVSSKIKAYETLVNQGGMANASTLYERFQRLEREPLWTWNFGFLDRVIEQSVIKRALLREVQRVFEMCVQDVSETLRQKVKSRASWQTSEDARYAYYEELKTYLTLFQLSDEPLVDQVQRVLQQMRKVELGLGQEDLAFMRGKDVVAWYFEENKNKTVRLDPELDHALVKSVRAQLSNFSLIAEFRKKLAEWEESEVWGDADLQTWLSDADALVLMESKFALKQVYSVKAWEKMVKPLIAQWAAQSEKHRWVLEKPLQGREWKETTRVARSHSTEIADRTEMEKAYFERYKTHWIKFLSGVKLKQSINLNEAVLDLYLLSDPDGAWNVLMHLVKENWVHADPAFEVHIKNSELKSIVHFLSDEDKGKKSIQLANYLSHVSALADDMDGLRRDANAPSSEPYLVAVFKGEGGQKNALMDLAHFLNEFNRYGKGGLSLQVFDRLLKEPMKLAFLSLSTDAFRHIQRDWQQQVVDPFNASLVNKFPFADSEEEVSFAEFSQFFNPKHGTATVFIKERLSPYLKEHHGRLLLKPWMGLNVPLNREVLVALEKFQLLSKGFFQPETGALGLNFHLRPEPSPLLAEFSIQVNGAQHAYRNEPEEWKRIAWPGNLAHAKAGFSITDTLSKVEKTRMVSGEWSLFRLLKQYAKISASSKGNYIVSLNFDPKTVNDADGSHPQVIFKIKTDSAESVLDILNWRRLDVPLSFYKGS